MSIYVTYLTIYSGNKLPPFYIGSSSLERVNNGYHGSVKSKIYMDIWKEELRNRPELFKTKIITQHNTRQEAYNKELLLQEKLKVVRSPLYINLSLASKDFDGSCLKGMPKTEEHKRKIGIAHKGKSTHKGKKWGPYPKERVEKLPTLKLNYVTVECPHCGKSGQYNNMKRWHFDNCKCINQT